MAEIIKEHDFVEVDYTGKLVEGTIFDTTLSDIARKNNLHSEKAVYQPAAICVGEGHLLQGLDKHLVGKEVGRNYTVTLQPEEAFGKRDIHLMKIVPMSTFKEHKVPPQPGLQINVDGEVGTITRVSGGRVIVNFNHPLAGKEVCYDFIVRRRIDDKREQVLTYLATTMRIAKSNLNVVVKDEKAEMELPFVLPPPVVEMLSKKLVELTGLKGVNFVTKQEKK
jgi:FKBP-type peptidyl-prolyl cis-trans isomerase 2